MTVQTEGTSGRRGPLVIGILAIAGLLAAVAAAGVVAFSLTLGVGEVTERALRYDIELEDEGDDLRVAVLDVRHFHRNLIFGGPSRQGVGDLENAMATLRAEIVEYGEVGVRDGRLPNPEDIDRMVVAYYAGFRSAIDSYDADRPGFTAASDAGLVRIAELDRVAQEVDKLGEERAEEALLSVEAASRQALVVLAVVLVGLGVAAAGLGYAAVRVLRELRRLNLAAQQTAGQLRAALQTKSEFIADASHELRTPLTVLRGSAEVGLAMGSDCAHGDVLREIVGESARMTKLVEDLLFLARSDAASLGLEREVVDVAPWLDDVAARAELLARERGAMIEAELLARGRVWIDARRVEQAVLALIDNAVRYGRPQGSVRIRSSVRDGHLRVQVGDDGQGISEEDLARVFDRFYRVDKARSHRDAGTGLGLPIARTIIEAHGGLISASSRAGQGTTMTIQVPLEARHQPQRRGDRAEPSQAAGKGGAR